MALTLAHADASIQRLGEILYDYLLPGPLELASVPDGELCHVTIAQVAPPPPAVARGAADGLTQLRAAVEHTLFAEVEAPLGRALTPEEGRRAEMPAVCTAVDFETWLKQRHRHQLRPLRAGSPLVDRLRTLHPYQRRDTSAHPLRLFAEHTNLAKPNRPGVSGDLVV